MSFVLGGHLLATASHDCILKFWCREPPGSRIENPPAPEFVESQPPIYGYGPLSIPPSNNMIPSVILHSSSTVATTSAQSAVGTLAQATGGQSRQSGMRVQNNHQQQMGNRYQQRGPSTQQRYQQQQPQSHYVPSAGKKRPREG